MPFGKQRLRDPNRHKRANAARNRYNRLCGPVTVTYVKPTKIKKGGNRNVP